MTPKAMLELLAPDINGTAATLGGAVRRMRSLFQDAGIVTAGLDARLLAAEACGVSQETLILNSGEVLRAEYAQRIEAFVARRLGGEPVSRIAGRREFWGLTFSISEDVLDPRPETELLVQSVLRHVKAKGIQNEHLRILDLGTGSGCLLGALLSELPRSFGIGIDRSEPALLIARHNISQLGLLDRAAFLCGDWMGAIGGAAFDVIVSNPPYIAQTEIRELKNEVKNFDPHLALCGGEDGLEAYRIILPEAVPALRPGGLFLCETGYGQASAVLDMLRQPLAAFKDFETGILTDLAGIERAVAGERQF